VVTPTSAAPRRERETGAALRRSSLSRSVGTPQYSSPFDAATPGTPVAATPAYHTPVGTPYETPLGTPSLRSGTYPFTFLRGGTFGCECFLLSLLHVFGLLLNVDAISHLFGIAGRA